MSKLICSLTHLDSAWHPAVGGVYVQENATSSFFIDWWSCLWLKKTAVLILKQQAKPGPPEPALTFSILGTDVLFSLYEDALDSYESNASEGPTCTLWWTLELHHHESEWQPNILVQTLTFCLPTSFQCFVVGLVSLMWSLLPSRAAWGQSAGIRLCGGASDCPGWIRLWVWLQAFYCSVVHDSKGMSQRKLSVSESGRFRIHMCHPWCSALQGLCSICQHEEEVLNVKSRKIIKCEERQLLCVA